MSLASSSLRILVASKEWPKAANALSGRLVRLAPALRRVGVAITFDRSGDRRQIIIEKQQPSSSS